MFGRKRRKEEREAAQRAAAEAAAAAVAARPESASGAQVPAAVGATDSAHANQSAVTSSAPVLDGPVPGAATAEPALGERLEPSTQEATTPGWGTASRHETPSHDQTDRLTADVVPSSAADALDGGSFSQVSTDRTAGTTDRTGTTATPAPTPELTLTTPAFIPPTPPRWTAADFHRGASPVAEGPSAVGPSADGASALTSPSEAASHPTSSSSLGTGSSAEAAASTDTSPVVEGSSPVPDPVSRGTADDQVSRGTGTGQTPEDPVVSVSAGGEGRVRRTRPQPVSVADVGAVYTWQTDPESTPGNDESPESEPARDEEPDSASRGTSDTSGALLPEVGGPTDADAGDLPPSGLDSSDDMRSTSTDSLAPATEEDERGTVEDLSDPSLGPVSTGVAVDPDEAARAALVESLPRPGDDTPLMAELQLDARRRIELRGRKFPRPEKTRVITVANQKGGVGKTTTTVNLAAALAQAGLHVLVLDNDPQGNASTALGIDHRAGTPSIYEVLVDGAPMHEAVQESPDVPGLFCLPATIDLSGAEIELVSMVARETRLRTALDNYLTWRIDNGLERIDYVFVDCPPSLGLLTVNAFVVAREVLIPIQCEYYALEGLSQLLKTIDLIQAHLNPQLSVSTILLTMYDARTNLAQQVAEEVRTHFPDRTLRTTVPRSVRISEAPSYGQTVMTYDNGSSGALAYLEAARELAERAEGALTSTDTPSGETVGAVKEDQ